MLRHPCSGPGRAGWGDHWSCVPRFWWHRHGELIADELRWGVLVFGGWLRAGDFFFQLLCGKSCGVRGAGVIKGVVGWKIWGFFGGGGEGLVAIWGKVRTPISKCVRHLSK